MDRLSFQLRGESYAFVPRAAQLEPYASQLRPSEAARLLAIAMADPSARGALRRAYCTLSHALMPGLDSDATVLAWLTHAVSRFGAAYVVCCGAGKHEAEPGHAPPDPKVQRLETLLTAVGRGAFVHQGVSYRVVRSARASTVKDRALYETLSPREAHQVLVAASADPRLEPQREALRELAASASELVVLRRLRVNVHMSEPPPLMTASQYREALTGDWFEFVLEDHRLGPLPGEAFELTLPSGQKQRAKTDAQGRFRVDKTKPGSCHLRFSSAMDHVPLRAELAWDALELGRDLPTNQVHRLKVKHNQADVLELGTTMFYPGTSVPLPVPLEFGMERANWGHSALSAVGHALRHAEREAGHALLVVGHASPNEGDVDALSSARARAVHALLKGDAKAFAEALHDPAGDATPVLLRWAAERHGYDCDPDDPPPPAEDEPSESAPDADPVAEALRRFRQQYNADDGGNLDQAAEGFTAADYEVLFTLYDRALAADLPDGADELAALRDGLAFHGPGTLAAGARWNVATAVDLLFLERDHPIPSLDITAIEGEHFHVDGRRVRRTSLPPEPPPPVTCIRMAGMQFDTDKWFLLPGAMSGIRRLVALYREHPAGELLVVGHTDTTGKPEHNDALSLARAKAVSAYLHDDAEAWLAHYDEGVAKKQRWGSTEDELMLRALPDAATHLESGTAWQSYQASRGLEADGMVGPKTRRRLIADYMALDGTSLPEGVSVRAHGCGENFPRFRRGDGVAEPRNRRVELFWFDEGVTPVPGEENSAAGAPEYAAWRARVVRTLRFDRMGPDFVLVMRVHHDVDSHYGTRLVLTGRTGRTFSLGAGEPMVTVDQDRSLRFYRFEAVPPGRYALHMVAGEEASCCVLPDIRVTSDEVIVGGQTLSEEENEEAVETAYLAQHDEPVLERDGRCC